MENDIFVTFSKFKWIILTQYVNIKFVAGPIKNSKCSRIRCSTRWNNLFTNSGNFFPTRVSLVVFFFAKCRDYLCDYMSVENDIIWYVALFAKKRFRKNFRIDTACFFFTREKDYILAPILSSLQNCYLFILFPRPFLLSVFFTFNSTAISTSARLA